MRLVAFHLPQFHPIPENDRWWGEGFTEWTNVERARPLFRGHDQPRVPTELGYYDLREPGVRSGQAELAAEHGIEAFCYWHYWFEGKRLLERPFAEILSSGEPSFPFCLAWANESWSRRWLGEERDILQEQSYSEADDVEHARWLAEAFADERYLRIDGRPVYLIYRPRHLPEPRRTAQAVRAECERAGLADPYLIGVDAHCPGQDCRELGFDSTLAFEPQLDALPDYAADGPKLSKLLRNLRRSVFSARLKIYDYAAARQLMTAIERDFPFHPCVFAGWDNSPRRGRDGVIVTGNTPERLEEGLREAAELVAARPQPEQLVFVNAWNEWAEGNYLEPDRSNGRELLEAVRRAATEPAPA
ncbi:MAG: glycoside hydrolase family 99-like domain-containing protein [Actinomycetota bacterium]